MYGHLLEAWRVCLRYDCQTCKASTPPLVKMPKLMQRMELQAQDLTCHRLLSYLQTCILPSYGPCWRSGASGRHHHVASVRCMQTWIRALAVLHVPHSEGCNNKMSAGSPLQALRSCCPSVLFSWPVKFTSDSATLATKLQGFTIIKQMVVGDTPGGMLLK